VIEFEMFNCQNQKPKNAVKRLIVIYAPAGPEGTPLVVQPPKSWKGLNTAFVRDSMFFAKIPLPVIFARV
jgi:hypothetical protein